MKTHFLFPFLFYISLFIINLQADVQNVYDIASRSVFKITSLDSFNNEIRYGYGVAIGKSECKDTNSFISIHDTEFADAVKNGADIITSYYNISFASQIFVENNHGKKCEAALVYTDSVKNIAIIRTKIRFTIEHPKISTNINVGKKVFAFCFDNHKNEMLRELYINEIKSIPAGVNYFNSHKTNQIVCISNSDKEIKSGVGIFDDSGNLIGLYQGKSIFNAKNNELIYIDDDINNKIRQAHSFNIWHPSDYSLEFWSIGKNYLTQYGEDLSYGLNWREKDERWIRWHKYDISIDLLNDIWHDKTNLKTKWFKTKSNPYEIVNDAIGLLQKKRASDFEYDIEGLMSYTLNSEYSVDSIKEINKIREVFGDVFYLNEKRFSNLYKITPEDQFDTFNKVVLDYIKNCPKYSRSLPRGIRDQIDSFKSTIQWLPEFNYEQSEIKRKSITEIVSFIDNLGWK